MWVKSEYAGELAVLSTWLSLFLPLNVSFRPVGEFGEMLFLYFPFFQIQYTWLNIEGSFSQAGLRLGDGIWIADPVSASLFYQTGSSFTANVAWAGAGALFLLAFALSLALYVAEERVENGPVDPVRTIGALLGLAGVAAVVSTALFWQNSIGTHLPVGTLVVLVLAGTLLTVDRTESDVETPDEDVESA